MKFRGLLTSATPSAPQHLAAPGSFRKNDMQSVPLIPLDSLKCHFVISLVSHFQLALQLQQRAHCIVRIKYSREQFFYVTRAICLPGSSWKTSTKKVLNRTFRIVEYYHYRATSKHLHSFNKYLHCPAGIYNITSYCSRKKLNRRI